MADSATFLESVGGDGSTVTGDANPTTGLANGGHRKRFVNALAQVVAVASNTVTKATEAAASALAAANSATAAATSLAETENYAEIVMAVANIDFANFEIVDGELLTTYIDSATSTPSIVDGEFVITY